MKHKTNTSKVLIVAIALLGISISSLHAQTGNVGINTDTPQVSLDVSGFPSNTSRFDGVRAPRITGEQLRAKTYTASQDGAIVYVTLADPAPAGQTIKVTEIGYYYFDKTKNSNAGEWVRLSCCTGEGSITALNCGSATHAGALAANAEAVGVSSRISYTGGNGKKYPLQVLPSTGVTGLTATCAVGYFANGDGSLTYTITGTPSAAGTASFALNIGGQTCTLTRTVSQPVTVITISGCGASIEAGGESMQLTAAVEPSTAAQAVTWASDLQGVAMVDATGKVTGFNGYDGDVTITATATDGSGVKATYKLRVLARPNVTDIDGNVYGTVKIGTQTWLRENLKVTQYNDGTAIPHIEDKTAWAGATTQAYCWYDNDKNANKEIYGALYNWHAVETGKLCPVGWHVPTAAEWTILVTYLGSHGYNYDGSTTNDGTKIAKAMALVCPNSLWNLYSDVGAVGNKDDHPAYNNKSGFSAVPSGYRGGGGGFGKQGNDGYSWSSEGGSSSARVYFMYYGRSYFSSRNDVKSSGFPVRCLKDN